MAGEFKKRIQQDQHSIFTLCRLDSLAEPYYLFQKKGYVTEIASLKGGPAPIETLSIEKPYSRLPLVKRFLNDGRCQHADIHAVATAASTVLTVLVY